MKIKVSNIDRSTTEEELMKLFEEFGHVEQLECGEMPDPGVDTFSAIVEMQYTLDAEEAIEELDGEQVDGRMLRVKEASDEDIDQMDQMNSRSEAEWAAWVEDEEGEAFQRIARKRPPREGGPPPKKKSKDRRPRD